MKSDPNTIIKELTEIRNEINELAFLFAKDSINPLNRIANKRARVSLSKLMHKCKDYRKIAVPLSRYNAEKFAEFKSQLVNQQTTTQ